MRRSIVFLVTLSALVVPGVDGAGPVSAASEPGATALGGSGYWILEADGTVHAFGAAGAHGDAELLAGMKAVDLEPTPSGTGYWVVDSGGHVQAFGDAVHQGDADQARLGRGELVTSLSSTPSGKGYWLFTTSGRALALGDAAHHGDMTAITLNAPVLDSVPTPSGDGYYMVAGDGGIFAFGDARFAGSMGGKPLNAPVQSLVPDGDGAGYWLVASDGGIFAFDAPFRGSMGGKPLNKPITGMVPYGDGYLMTAEDGGIFNFSDQSFAGSLGGKPPAHPVVAVAALAIKAGLAAAPTGAPDGSPETPSTTGPSTVTSRPAVVMPADTGTPDWAPTHVLPCQSSSEAATVWATGPDVGNSEEHEDWAANNPCPDQWLIIDEDGLSESDPYGRALSVAPGARFHRPVDEWDADEGPPRVVLADAPLDGAGECPVGYVLWAAHPGATEFELLADCPDADDLGWHDDESSGVCFGLEPDYLGTEGDDVWGNENDDLNGDGEVVISGLGGDDSWSSGSLDSGTFTDTWFCGGDGNDTAEGWLAKYKGGEGTDRFSPTTCGRKPLVTEVEHIDTPTDCPDDMP